MTIKTSDRLSKIKPSPTFELAQKAKEMKAAGRDVISLTLGEPDFDTPDHIKAAGKKAIDEGFTKYTPVPGIPELKDAIRHKFKEDNGLDYARDEVMASTGGKQSLYNALMASVNEGDEVIIPAPYWVSYPDMTLLAQGIPVIVECSDKDGFRLNAEALKSAITDKTKWLILNSPSNPTGATYSQDDLRKIADVLVEFPHVNILSDEIYEHLTYEGFVCVSILQVAPELKDRTVIVNGLAKAFSMTGWRMGFAAGPKEIIAAMTKVQSQSTSNPCSIVQKAAITALTEPRDFLDGWIAKFKERRDLVWERMNEIPGLTCYKSEGAFYLYPNCGAFINKKSPDGIVINSDADFVSYLLESFEVAVVPGSAFGLSPFFRISYAASVDELNRACDRIREACASLS